MTADISTSNVPVVVEREVEAEGDEEDVDDEEAIKAGEEPSSHPAVGPRWPTKVFAAESLHRIVTLCEGNKAHFDLTMAREERSIKPKGKQCPSLYLCPVLNTNPCGNPSLMFNVFHIGKPGFYLLVH